MKTPRLLAAFLAPFVLASVATAGTPPVLSLGNFHAKVHMTNSGGAKALAADGEIWMKEKKMRMNISAVDMKTSTIMADGFVYTWPIAPNQGMKMAIQPQHEGGSLLKANECLKTAKSLGIESIEGVATEKYEYKDCGQAGTATTIWIATGKGYPKKMETVSKGTTTTILYKDVETSASIADKVFTPPADIQFQDMAEMMKKMQQNQQKAGGKH